MKTQSEPIKPNVLFVDDDLSMLNTLKRFGRNQPWQTYTAISAEKALQTMEKKRFDVVVSDMRMPDMTGDIFLEKVKCLTPLTTRILLTGHSDMHAVESAINKGKIFGYVTKPWNKNNLEQIVNDAIAHHNTLESKDVQLNDAIQKSQKLSKVALLLDKQAKERSLEVDQALNLLNGLNDQANKNFRESLSVLTLVLEWKEGRDAGHLEFVAEYGVKIASHLGLPQSDIDHMALAGNLHRIGILCLPDELRLRPPFSFDTEERKLYQKHPIWGEMALSTADSLAPIGKIIRHQHEAVNGTGYPDNLCDKEIPLLSKILAVVSDFYDAHNGRLERKISGIDDAKNYIRQWAGKKYDVVIIDALFNVLGDFGIDDTRKMTITSEDLEVNMTVVSDIVSANGTSLLTQGSQLSHKTIIRLKEFEKKYNQKLYISVELSDRG